MPQAGTTQPDLKWVVPRLESRHVDRHGTTYLANVAKRAMPKRVVAQWARAVPGQAAHLATSGEEW